MQLPKKILFIIIGLFVITAGIVIVIAGGYTNAPTPQVTEDSLSRGLVGYWDFEEGSGQTAYDKSGNGNNGTLGADANPGSDDPKWTTAGGLTRQSLGGGGGALSFDGSDDYVQTPVITSQANYPYTYSLWFNDGGSTEGCMVELGNYKSNAHTIYLNRDLTPDQILLSRLSAYKRAVDISSISPGEWHHLVAVYKSDSDIEGYLDGVLATITGTDYWSSGYGYTRFGGARNAYFDGLISDVRIYNRALSPEEIRYLYNRGGPVSRWGLDEGSGSTAYDSSSNSNDLTLTNMEAGDWQTGKSGSGLSFDGTNEYLTRA